MKLKESIAGLISAAILLSASSVVLADEEFKVDFTQTYVVTNEAYLVAYNDVRLEKQAKYTSNMTYHEFYVFPDATGLNIEVTAYIAVFTLCACLYVVSKRKKHRYSR